MAILCPITGTRVVYLECLECDEKICKTGRSTRPVSAGSQNEPQSENAEKE